MKYVRRVMAMFLSVVMVIGLMTGVGAPRVMAAYETDIIDVEFKTIYNGAALWNGALWLNMLSNATAKYYIHDVVTWPKGQEPKIGGDYSYTKPTWSITPSDVVQVHGIDDEYEQDASKNYNSGISLSPLKKGTATLTWTTGKVTKTFTINVVDVLAKSVTVSPQSVSLSQVGQQQQLTAVVTPATASQKVIWTTSDPTVATVDSNGLVTAVGAGACDITANSTGDNKEHSDYAKVSVVLSGEAAPVYYFKSIIDNMELSIGKTGLAPFSSFYSDAAQTISSKVSDFTYASDTPGVATVNSNGLITAVGEGTAKITMTPINTQGEYKNPYTFTVKVVSEVNQTGVYSVSIDPASISLMVGGQKYLNISVNADSEDKKNVKVTSSDKTIASVGTDQRTIWGKAPGTATITATSTVDPTKYAQCIVTVTDKVEVTGITLNKTATTLEAGSTETLTATVATSGDVDKTLSWTSSNTSVATVDNNGKITAVAQGTATITAISNSNNQVKATCTVTVTAKKVPVTSITLSSNSISLDARDNSKKTATLTAAVLPADASDKSITWTSSNPSVATVANGVVTAVGGGTATITAKANGGSNCQASCTVTVATPVESITLSKTNLTLNKNGTATITATVNPTGATNKTITAQSKNTDVATVSQNADGSYQVKGVATGHTDIVFTAKDNDTIAKCAVTVEPTKVSSIGLKDSDGTVIGDALELTIGNSRQLSAVISPADADNKELTWESSNTDVIAITPQTDSSKCAVTAKSIGEAELRAISKDGGASASVKITVKSKYVTNIQVSATDNKTTLKKGETVQLLAKITPSDATNPKVTWSSSDSAFVTVNTDGKVSVVADSTVNKTVTITATAQDGSNKSGSIALTVVPTPVESFSISGGSVGVGKSLQLAAKSFVPETATNKTITNWVSSNANIASVDASGLVTGKSAGTVTITATCADGKTATSSVTVVSNVVDVSAFTVENETKTLTVGESCTINATVKPDNATDKTLIWNITSGKDVVDITDETDTSAPVFKANKPGTATVEVKSASNTTLPAKLITITVKPKYVNSITITPSKTGSIKQGETIWLGATVLPSDATDNTVTWASSDENLATVNAYGEVKIKTTGATTAKTVQITATANDGAADHIAVSKTYEIQIAAQQAATVMVSSVAISGESTRDVKTGEKPFTVTAEVAPANATDKTLAWKVIEGEGVVGISADGASCTVTPISEGSAKIQVSSVSNPAASAILVVNVTADVQHIHTYTEEIIQQATCTKTGVKKYTCECGDVKTETIPALGHSYIDTVVAPTTDSQGYTRHTCSRCGSYYDDNYVPKLEPTTQDPTTEDPTTEQPQDEKDMPKVGKSVDVSGARYKVTKSSSKTKEVTYVKPKNSKKTSVKIPNTVKINGYTYKVTAIADKAFKNNKKIKSVTIGKNVKKIGKEAFYNCKKLSKITIKSAVLKTVGKNAIKNIYKKATIKVPKKQLKKYKKLFKSKTGFKKTMKIKK